MEEQTIDRPPTKELLRDKHVLIVDDEKELTLLLSRVFSRKGAVIETAKDGEEALQRISEKKPDLIITDNSMPNMNGPELIRRLRENSLTHNVPVLLMSGDLFAGLNQEEIQEKALSLQANAGTAKPFANIFALADIAEQLLSQKQS